MTEEEFKVREDELTAQVAKEKADKEAAVSELIAKRESERQVKEELDKLKETQKSSVSIENPEDLVNKVLEKREQESVKHYFDDVKSEFQNAHVEFSKEKDPAGILLAKFEAELAKFNFNGLRTKEDIAARFKEAYRLMNNIRQQDDQVDFYKGAKSIGADAKTDDGNVLTAAESKLIKELDWTKERYLAQKAARPDFVAKLLSLRSI